MKAKSSCRRPVVRQSLPHLVRFSSRPSHPGSHFHLCHSQVSASSPPSRCIPDPEDRALVAGPHGLLSLVVLGLDQDQSHALITFRRRWASPTLAQGERHDSGPGRIPATKPASLAFSLHSPKSARRNPALPLCLNPIFQILSALLTF